MILVKIAPLSPPRLIGENTSESLTWSIANATPGIPTLS
jgi:hypothetical protein